MSLITRCPACETMFKVVPDQLRVSDGWVRCGQCDEIFDASNHLVDVAAAAAMVAPDDRQQPVSPAAAETAETAEAEQLDEAALAASALQAPPPGLAPEADPGFAAIEPVREEFRVPDQADAWAQNLAGHADAGPPPVAADMAGGHTGSPDVSFMLGSGSRGAFWRRPLVRAGLLLAGGLLCIGMAVQIIVHERDRIAAVEPGLRPLVEGVCAAMQCTLAPLRQIDAVVIESASFNRMRGDVYRLNFTLKNTASIDLAVPAIELSLTDSQDQPIMRRVFKPGEFGARSAVLPGASESSGSIALSIKTNGQADRMAGYRILAFYP